MRKHLLGGAAAAAAGLLVAFPAAAQDDMMMGLSLSGNMKQDIGFGNWRGGAEAESSMHFDTDATIKFTATGATDSGLGISVVVELDGDSVGGIKDNHMTISGGFGQFILGGEDNAAKMHGGTGGGGSYGGMGYYGGGDDYTPQGSGGPGKIGGTQAQGIRYSLPSIGGFQAGISFQPDSSTPDDKSEIDNNNNVMAIGANFTTDLGGNSLAIGGGWISLDDDDGASSSRYGLGTNLGIGNTTVSLRYDNHSDSETSYGIGVDHSLGAMTFGVGYGTRVVEGANTGATGVKSDKTTSTIQFGGSYDMGGSVDMSAGFPRVPLRMRMLMARITTISVWASASHFRSEASQAQCLELKQLEGESTNEGTRNGPKRFCGFSRCRGVCSRSLQRRGRLRHPG